MQVFHVEIDITFCGLACHPCLDFPIQHHFIVETKEL